MNHISTIALCALLACSPCVAQDEQTTTPPPPSNTAAAQARNASAKPVYIAGGISRRLADSIIAALDQEAGSKVKVWRTDEPTGNSRGGSRVQTVIWGQGDFEGQTGLLERMRKIAATMIDSAYPARRALAETIDFSFPGGTAEEFLTALMPQNVAVNIVYDMPAAKLTPIPALRVKQLSRQSILDLMQDLGSQSNAAEGQFSHSWRTASGGESEEQDTMLVRRDRYNGPSSGESSTSPQQNSADLEPAVLRIPPADATSDEAKKGQERAQQQIISAIDDGIQLRGGASSTFKIKLNPATGILFVQGNYAEKKLVTTIVNAMKPEALVAAPPPTPPASGANRSATPR